MIDEKRKTFLLCSRCSTATINTLQCSLESDVEHYDADGYRMHEPATYSVFRCDGCTQVSIYIRSAFHRPYSEFGEQAYPPLLQEVQDIPSAVQRAYHQAEQVRSHSNAAYAVLARKVLEVIAKERGIDDRNLSHAISVMAAKGDIPPLLAEAATLIRTFGNTAAHDSETSITGIHVQMIEKFLAILIQSLYAAPAALRNFKHLLDIESDETPDT